MRRFRAKSGNQREREAFLFFPKWIGDEMRWWESAVWIEEFVADRRWVPVQWDCPCESERYAAVRTDEAQGG